VPVECVNHGQLEVEIGRLGDFRSLDEAEILRKVRSHSDVTEDAGCCAEHIGVASGQVCCRIRVVERNRIDVVRQVDRIKDRLRRWIPVPAPECRTQDRAARHLVEPDTFRPSRRCRCAAKRQRLPAFVTLNPADLPSADDLIESSSTIDKALPFTDRKLIEVADDEVVGQILVAD